MIGVAPCSVLVAVVGYLVADQIEQREQFDHSHAALTGTQHRISTVSAQLASLEHELLVLTDQVGSDTTAFDQATSQLKGAQTALEAAQANLTQQASLITSLQTCLGGVEQALNALSVNNQLAGLGTARVRVFELHDRGGSQWLIPARHAAAVWPSRCAVLLGLGVLATAIWTDVEARTRARDEGAAVAPPTHIWRLSGTA